MLWTRNGRTGVSCTVVCVVCYQLTSVHSLNTQTWSDANRTGQRVYLEVRTHIVHSAHTTRIYVHTYSTHNIHTCTIFAAQIYIECMCVQTSIHGSSLKWALGNLNRCMGQSDIQTGTGNQVDHTPPNNASYRQ